MLKILHVVEPLASGILHSIAKLCWGLEKEFRFHILHGVRIETPADFQSYFPPSVEFSRWRISREIDPLADLTALIELRRAVVEIQPDVLHAHSSKAGVLARLPWIKGGRPVVFSPRGYAFLREDISRPSRWMYRTIERLLGLAPHVTVACGQGEYDCASRVTSHAVLIPNMVDMRDFPGLVVMPPCAEGMRVAMVGSIRPQKNFPLFCEVARALSDLNIQFVWIGSGTPPHGIQVPENVRITGWLPRQRALNVLTECQVFLQTSLWEGLPIALLEGMALGLAALAKPAVGNTELISEGVNGYLCDDTTEFAGRLRALFEDRIQLREMGRASRRIVEDRYATDRILGRWRELYSSLTV